MLIDALEITDLALARGDRLLFEDFSLRLAAGEAVALTGPNGAGKTSLLRAIAGFIRPLAGRINFAGAADPHEARSRGLHFLGHQDGLKPGRLARDELAFQVRWTGGDADGEARARERLQLEPLLDLEIRKLSAGQRRRLSLARLIAAPRSLWLLDEPLGPLDAARRATFAGIMQEYLAGGGMILAAVHDPLPIPARAVEVGQ